MVLKASISRLIIFQAVSNLESAIEARKNHDIDKECQIGINVHLLLGIALEGIINDIGQTLLDEWTWNEFEKITTPLKWKLIGKFENSAEEPLQTIIKIQKIRNKIAHTKIQEVGNESIAVNEIGEFYKLQNNHDLLPENDFKLYIGYSNFYKDFNAETSLQNTRKTLSAIQKINEIHKMPQFDWINDLQKKVFSMKVEKNKWKKNN